MQCTARNHGRKRANVTKQETNRFSVEDPVLIRVECSPDKRTSVVVNEYRHFIGFYRRESTWNLAPIRRWPQINDSAAALAAYTATLACLRVARGSATATRSAVDRCVALAAASSHVTLTNSDVVFWHVDSAMETELNDGRRATSGDVACCRRRRRRSTNTWARRTHRRRRRRFENIARSSAIAERPRDATCGCATFKM